MGHPRQECERQRGRGAGDFQMIDIVDFLAAGSKAEFAWANEDIDWLFAGGDQTAELDHGASIRLPQVWKELLDNPVMHSVPKCKNLESDTVGSLCWTGCGEAGQATCSKLNTKRLQTRGARFVKLAEYDFAGDWSKGHRLGCHGVRNFGRNIRRSVCGLANMQPSPEDIERLGSSFRLEAIPEPFRSEMDDHEIEKAFRAHGLAGRSSDLHRYLNFLLPNFRVPMVLKRLAVMAYYDFAQRPLPWDLLPARAYATRLSRFLSAWVSSPTDQDWEESMCPSLRGAGCAHIVGGVWEQDDGNRARGRWRRRRVSRQCGMSGSRQWWAVGWRRS
ncbi:unnamed protein product [Prorocentrum cordatum]|uniref:Uncharacterized protein n=1 Tax=Prorocentrum cordatum TaxID=2364126 RepID=A0ABN9XVT2_9DINO|nr:unnamed protein product [Polarella glacialis]